MRFRTSAAAWLFFLAAVAGCQQDRGNQAVNGTQQALRGERVYANECASCHGAAQEGGTAPALRGSAFVRNWSQGGRSVDDLFYIMRTTMPRPNTGSLPDSSYLDVLAYLLQQNGVAAGSTALTAKTEVLSAIRLTGEKAANDSSNAKLSFIAGAKGTKPTASGPTAAELERAGGGGDWLYHTGSFAGTRYSPLNQITTANIAQLEVACVYQIGSQETFIPGPVVHQGVMYLTTALLTVAVDAADCKERWRHTWKPQDDMLWGNNRGVAVQDGYVVRGTADGYLVALDAATGALLWARQVARPVAGETITMPPLVHGDRIFIAPAGSENGVQGWIGAFRLSDGSELWRFNTVPRPGEPGAETWANPTKIPLGGGAVWTPLSYDAAQRELYVAVTNPAPDLPANLRPGKNLYTNSVLALDAMTGKLRWYDQLVPSDDKDWDVTQVSPLFSPQIGGRSRNLIATSGKDGVVRVLDRETKQRLYETPLGTQINTKTPITKAGTRYCPGVLGGVQWNGPAWHPGTGMLYVNSVDWCFTGYLADTVRYVPGENYMGGRLVPDSASSGWLTAIDGATGQKRWSYHSPRPMVSAVTTTAGGLVLTGELDGDLLAFDAANGRELFRFKTGGSMAGGVVTYSVAGTQYIGAVSGRGSAYFGGKGAAGVHIFKLR